MPKTKPIDVIHDLFASTHKSVMTPQSDASTRFHGDVYEELALLDYIYVDEMADFLAEDNEDMSAREPISLADFFEGLTQLAAMGVVEVTDIVESIHREIILRPLGRFNEGNLNNWQRSITGRIYSTVRQAMLLVGNNLVSGLRLYNQVRNRQVPRPLPASIKQFVNVLNGVMGDHLVNHDNPIAVPMVLYDRCGYPQREAIVGRVVILCHGLCLSHLSWEPCESDSLGERIMQSQSDTTIYYLDYNTGRRISRNGRNFANVLQTLITQNPDISQIDLVGHSMGGLVARSALFYGKQAGQDWVQRVRNLVTLGSPHHGAMLERIGYLVQDVIAKLPFAGSLAKLGDLRSAGIIDLRYGSIRDADWKSLEGRNVLPHDFRHPARLPQHVNTYCVAATLARNSYDAKTTRLLGDGLVTVKSALGEDKSTHSLFVPEGRKAVFYGVSHMNLLYNARVHEQVVAWLLDNGQSHYSLITRIYSYPNILDEVV